jgi:hypothetical protein
MKKTKTLQDMVDELLPYLLKIEIDSENSFLPTITIYLPKMWEVRQNNEEILIHTEHLNNKTMLYSFYSNTLLLDDLVKEVSDVIRLCTNLHTLQHCNMPLNGGPYWAHYNDNANDKFAGIYSGTYASCARGIQPALLTNLVAQAGSNRAMVHHLMLTASR